MMLLLAYRLLTTCFCLFTLIFIFCANITMAHANDGKVKLTKQEQLYIQQYPTIKVHSVEDWHPFNFIENGIVSGYNNDLIRLVANKVGLDIEFIFAYQWNEYLEKLRNKEIDVISSISLQQKQQILNRWLPVIHENNRAIFAYWLAIVSLSFIVVFLLILLYFSKKKNKQLEKTTRKLERIAMRDYLTGVPNLPYFKEQLKKEWARARRSHEDVSLLIIDIDRFKRFNEQYGPLAGDRYLVELAARLQGIVKRPADLLARFEDDEFIILLPGTGEEGLRAVAAEIFYMTKSWRFKFKKVSITNALSMSVGAACMPSSGQFPETELTRRAEQALYQAQDKGCNQMVIYQQSR
tara:strand:- start:7242 stop:8297 length:1056 start_codon:yes stop_codon:yes gene_type:complete